MRIIHVCYGLALYVLAIGAMYDDPVYKKQSAGASAGKGRFKGSGNTQSVVPQPFGLEQPLAGGRTGRVKAAPGGFGPVKTESKGGFHPVKGSSKL